MRDAAVYGLSIVMFILFSWDGKMEWYESLILLSLYVFYIVVMKFNPQLMRLLEKIECRFCRFEIELNIITHEEFHENEGRVSHCRGTSHH